MSQKKMLVVYLASTNAVLAAASRCATGEPPVEDLVGASLPVRIKAMESGVPIAAGDLKVKEVDFDDGVFRKPLNYSKDSSGAVILVAPTVLATITSSSVALTLAPASPADKSVIVVVDIGPNREPLKFTSRTTAAATLNVPVTGVPPGMHDVLISVDGYVSLVQSGSF